MTHSIEASCKSKTNTKAPLQNMLMVLVISFLLSSTALAETYLVDFSQFETPGGNWNSLQSNQTSNVPLTDDDTGSLGSATLSHTLGGVDSNISGGWTAGNVGWVHTAAVSDGIYSVPNGTLTINGLFSLCNTCIRPATL